MTSRDTQRNALLLCKNRSEMSLRWYKSLTELTAIETRLILGGAEQKRNNTEVFLKHTFGGFFCFFFSFLLLSSTQLRLKRLCITEQLTHTSWTLKTRKQGEGERSFPFQNVQRFIQSVQKRVNYDWSLSSASRAFKWKLWILHESKTRTHMSLLRAINQWWTSLLDYEHHTCME